MFHLSPNAETRFLRMKIKTQKTKARKGRNKVRFPGIIADAEALGTHRMHLYQVLAKKRTSHCLMARYRELKASQKGGAKP